METAKYIISQIPQPSHHDFVKDPLHIKGFNKEFGEKEFGLIYEAIREPGTMIFKTHRHTFDQYLCFVGGDPTNMLELHGEVELFLSEDGMHQEKHIITKATTVYVPAGLYHCPLVYTRVDKPFLFIDIYFSRTYNRTDMLDQR